MLTCTINGEAHTLPVDAAVPAALRAIGLDPSQPGIAVARNDAVVRRADWAATTLEDGDRLEVITATQGG